MIEEIRTNKWFLITLVLLVLAGVVIELIKPPVEIVEAEINLIQPKDEPYYRVYVSETHLIYVDGTTGDTIFTEEVNWDNPTELQQTILKDLQ